MNRGTKGAVAAEPVQIEQLLSISQVMKVLHLGRDTVNKLILKGEIPAFKIGSRYKVVPSSLIAWQREQSGI